MNTHANTRVRFRYSKLGKVRFTSHRDVARMWERALRRVELPVAYTEGFSPRPRLSFGLALPTSAESLGEYLDIDLAGGPPVDHEAICARLSSALPVGIDVQGAVDVLPGTPSLQQSVLSCGWRIEVVDVAPAALEALVAAALGRDEIVVTRVRKGQPVSDDLRPFVLSLAVTGQTETGSQLEVELATKPRGVRPAELIDALGGEGGPSRLAEGRVCRTYQWMQVDGARREPIPLDATSPPHAVARAS